MCKSCNNERNRFEEKEFAGNQREPFQILTVANAVVKKKSQQILNNIEGNDSKQSKSKFVYLKAKKLNIRNKARDNRNKLREKQSNHHASYDRNNRPRWREIIRIFNLLRKEIFDVGIAVENRKYDDVSENTPENTIYHPIVMFYNSYQAINFLQK